MKSPFEELDQNKNKITPSASSPAAGPTPVAPSPVAPSPAAPPVPTQLSVDDIFSANAGHNAPCPVPVSTAPAAATAAVPAYKPSGRIGDAALPVFLLYTPVAALLCGYLYSVSTQYMNPVVIGELLLGLLLGVLLIPAIRLGKCRNRRMAVVVGIIAGVLTIFAYLAFDAAAERKAYVDGFTQVIVRQSGQKPEVVRAKIEQIFTPSRYFRIYMADRAASGITLLDSDKKRISGSQSGTHLAGTAYWLFLGGEILLVSLMAAGVLHNAAGARFSEEHNKWYRKKSLYAVHPSHVPELVDLARAGDWTRAGALAKASKTGGANGASFTVYDVPPSGGGYMTITMTDGNNQTHTLFEAPVTADEIKQMRPAT